MEAQAVEQPHPLAELAVSGLGRGPQLQVEGAAGAELDLELPAAFVVNEELDELQGEQPGRAEGRPQVLTLPGSTALPSRAPPGSGSPTSTPLSLARESPFSLSLPVEFYPPPYFVHPQSTCVCR